ncbi:MAG: ROK family protein [Candidatus Cyclobacteriaceae bacterium M3_2C_046]
MNTIAIDLGGTNIKIALLQDNRIRVKSSLPALSGSGLKIRLPVIEQAINQLLVENKLDPSQLQGIGLAFPGLVNIDQQKVISTNKKFDDALNLDLSHWAYQSWQIPLVMDNDARMALRGEWQYGAGKGCDNLVMVTLGTGVGGAALINGQVLYGKHYQAGCLGGHFTINFKGRTCTCGNIGCVESEAAGWSLPGLIRSFPEFKHSGWSSQPVLDFKLLFQLVRTKDPLAIKLLDHCLDAWSAGIISMIHAYDPEMVILSGGIMQSGDLMLPVLKEKINQLAWTPWGKVELKQAHYINEAALYGANFMLQQQNIN